MHPLTLCWRDDTPYLNASYANILLSVPNHESLPAYADEHTGL